MKPYIWIDLAHIHHKGHDMHPEHPSRVEHIYKRLSNTMINNLKWTILDNDINLTDSSNNSVSSVWSFIDKGDTYITPYTSLICNRAMSMISESVKSISKNQTKCAFVACRPPGHHKGLGDPSGFCHINNIWFAAESFHKLGYKKIAIFDWDVHHGDGTEELVRNNVTKIPNIKFVSMHAYGRGIYPGTGVSSSDKNVLNIGLKKGTSEKIYLEHFRDQVLPFLDKPDILLVSAGYDAHVSDPMGLMKLTAETYGTMSRELMDIGCPVLFILEGGYNPEVLAVCVEETLVPWLNY